MILFLLFVLLECALFVGGLTVIGKATRSRPAYPCCRGCDYQLTGILERTEHCPECGLVLSQMHVIPALERETRIDLLIVGIVMVVLSIPSCCIGSAILG